MDDFQWQVINRMENKCFPGVDKLKSLVEKLCNDEVIQTECSDGERKKILDWADVLAGTDMNEYMILKVLRSHATLDDYTQGTVQIAKYIYLSIARKILKSNE